MIEVKYFFSIPGPTISDATVKLIVMLIPFVRASKAKRKKVIISELKMLGTTDSYAGQNKNNGMKRNLMILANNNCFDVSAGSLLVVTYPAIRRPIKSKIW